MAVWKPFRGIRPVETYAEQIAALPYDVYNREEAQAEVAAHPMSFLRMDRAEVNFPPEVDAYDPRVYAEANRLFRQAIEQGYYLQDTEEQYYIYELTMNGRVQNGIVGCASIEDYENNIIRKHENTLPAKEQDRIHHVDAMSAQSGPIFLSYRSNPTLKALVSSAKQAPLYDFVAEDQVRHRMFAVTDPEQIQAITEAFQEIPCLYIADGHHRAASAVQVGKMRRAQHEGSVIPTTDDASGQDKNRKTAEYHYFLSVAFPEEELQIMDYNRVVSDLNGLSPEVFLDALSEVCHITEIGALEMEDDASKDFHPTKKGTFSMYLRGVWYRCAFLPNTASEDAVESLDVARLQTHVLDGILGIYDPKTSSRIQFVGGIRGLQTLEEMTGDGVAFAMYPTSMQELFRVADEGRLMPPKSTWFEPKLRSGLVIHEIDR